MNNKYQDIQHTLARIEARFQHVTQQMMDYQQATTDAIVTAMERITDPPTAVTQAIATLAQYAQSQWRLFGYNLSIFEIMHASYMF